MQTVPFFCQSQLSLFEFRHPLAQLSQLQEAFLIGVNELVGLVLACIAALLLALTPEEGTTVDTNTKPTAF